MMYQTMINVYIAVNDLIPISMASFSNCSRSYSPPFCRSLETFFVYLFLVGSSILPPFQYLWIQIQIVMLAPVSRSFSLSSCFHQQQVCFIPESWKNDEAHPEIYKKHLLQFLFSKKRETTEKTKHKRQMIKKVFEDFFWRNLRMKHNFVHLRIISFRFPDRASFDALREMCVRFQRSRKGCASFN